MNLLLWQGKQNKQERLVIKVELPSFVRNFKSAYERKGKEKVRHLYNHQREQATDSTLEMGDTDTHYKHKCHHVTPRKSDGDSISFQRIPPSPELAEKTFTIPQNSMRNR